MQPSMLLKLLRKLTVDVSKLSEYTTVALRVRRLFLTVARKMIFRFHIKIITYCKKKSYYGFTIILAIIYISLCRTVQLSIFCAYY